MTWWEVLGVFVGIPAALFVTITLLVMRFSTARVPDGLPRAATSMEGATPAPDDVTAPAAAEAEGDQSIQVLNQTNDADPADNATRDGDDTPEPD